MHYDFVGIESINKWKKRKPCRRTHYEDRNDRSEFLMILSACSRTSCLGSPIPIDYHRYHDGHHFLEVERGGGEWQNDNFWLQRVPLDDT